MIIVKILEVIMVIEGCLHFLVSQSVIFLHVKAIKPWQILARTR